MKRKKLALGKITVRHLTPPQLGSIRGGWPGTDERTACVECYPSDGTQSHCCPDTNLTAICTTF
jgi:hypothetical protein